MSDKAALNLFAIAKPLDKNISVAITLHIFYEDYVDRFYQKLSKLDFNFDLFVSVPSIQIEKKAIKKFSSLKCRNLVVKVVPNRGRNFAPLLVEFSKSLINYEVFAHLHSKKSLFTGKEQFEWSDYLLESLISPYWAKDHLSRLSQPSDQTPGLIFPMKPPGLPYWANHWLKNSRGGRFLNNNLGLNLKVSGPITYPIGGMFWARTDSLIQLLSFPWNYDHFEEESGQIDGTLAHAVERYISALVKHNGFSSLAYDSENAIATPDKGYVLDSYVAGLSQVSDSMLINMPVLSVDFFDTIACRNSANDDIAKFRAAKTFLVEPEQILEFVNLRNDSETVCRHNKDSGDVGLDEISKEFSKRLFREIGLSISPEDLVSAECDAEYSGLRPKTRIVSIIQQRQSLENTTIVASDTYYQYPHMVKFLESVGLEHKFIDLQISSETGLRKDRGDYWAEVSKKYGGHQEYLHIGDNFVSDIQNAGDYGLRNLLLPSAKELAILHGYKLSEEFEDSDSISNNFLLGIFQSQYANSLVTWGGGLVDF